MSTVSKTCNDACTGLEIFEGAICVTICEAFLPAIQQRASVITGIIQTNTQSLVIREYVIEGVLIFFVFFFIIILLVYQKLISASQAFLITILVIIIIAVIQTYRVFDVLNSLQSTSDQVVQSLP